MIQKTVRERCKKLGITSGYQLQKALDISSPDTANRLWKGDFKRIDLDTLSNLCRVLKCQPNMLFKYIPDK